MIPKHCACSIIIPTRDRRAILADTLRRIRDLPDDGFETIVVDNGSTHSPESVIRDFPDVRWIRLDRNLNSAARNVGAAAARGKILFMLDDDSWPEPGAITGAIGLMHARSELAAAACRVLLAESGDGSFRFAGARHDAGGVPGVIFNCGAVIRRDAFLAVGGFPIDYEYYVEEYDLCCRLWQAGWRVEPQGELIVWHRRTAQNRNADQMIRLLIRNNVRLWRKFAPEPILRDVLDATIERYCRVAIKENAKKGFRLGLEEIRAESAEARLTNRPLTISQFEDLFGLKQARARIRSWAKLYGIGRVAIWTRGKGCEQLAQALNQLGVEIDAVYDSYYAHEEARIWRGLSLRDCCDFDSSGVDGIVIGSLSPGVAEDLQKELSLRFPLSPVLSAVPWKTKATMHEEAAI